MARLVTTVLVSEQYASEMAYELWETATGNLIGAYATEGDALALIRAAIENHGAAYVTTILLGYEDSSGRSKTLAVGKELAERALAAQPT